MPTSRKAAFAAGAVFALILGSGTAYAATGGNFILGKSNRAGTTTALNNPNGTALTLKSKSGTPALSVSNQVKVPRLNSDLVDGRDSTAFALTAGRTAFLEFASQGIDTNANGVNDLFVASAVCPAGTKRTGGGASEFTASGLTFVNTADTGNSWVVAVLTDDVTVEDPLDVVASVVCYNPRGGVSGGTARTTQESDVMDRISDGLARKIRGRAIR